MSWQLFYKEKEAVNGPTDRIYVFIKYLLSKNKDFVLRHLNEKFLSKSLKVLKAFFYQYMYLSISVKVNSAYIYMNI